MSDGGILQILRGIKENTGGDEVIYKFLGDLIYEEIDAPWRWRDIYREKIEKYSKEWEWDDSYEN